MWGRRTELLDRPQRRGESIGSWGRRDGNTRHECILLRLRRLPNVDSLPNLGDGGGYVTGGRVEQTDRRHASTSGVRLRGSYEVAKRRIKTFAKRLKCFQIDLSAVSWWSPLERPNVFNDSGHRVDDTFHRLKHTRRGIGATSS